MTIVLLVPRERSTRAASGADLTLHGVVFAIWCPGPDAATRQQLSREIDRFRAQIGLAGDAFEPKPLVHDLSFESDPGHVARLPRHKALVTGTLAQERLS